MSLFETTKWSLVLAARNDDHPDGHAALAELCQIYWYPLYAFTRSKADSAEQARDWTQGFFVHLLERRPLSQVSPAGGRFRAFLLASLKNYLSHERERQAALKRGGGQSQVSLDAAEAEARFRIEPRDDRTPDRLFERSWAMTVLERVSKRLEAELTHAGKGREYQTLACFLGGSTGGKPYAVIAAELDTTEAAIKMGVRRLRQRFGALLREEIAQTVESSDEIDRELKHLLAVVQQ